MTDIAKENRKRVAAHLRACGEIQAEIRRYGSLDLYGCLRDKVRLGALATLEEDGSIRRAGDVDAQQRQPYVIAKDTQERERFRSQRIEADRASWERRR